VSIRRKIALALEENSSMRLMALRLTVALKVIVVQVVLPLIGLVAGIYLFGAVLKDPDTYGRVGALLIRALIAFLRDH
jgi:hypothetical protein